MKFERQQSSNAFSTTPTIAHIIRTNRHSSKIRYFVRDLELDC